MFLNDFGKIAAEYFTKSLKVNLPDVLYSKEFLEFKLDTNHLATWFNWSNVALFLSLIARSYKFVVDKMTCSKSSVEDKILIHVIGTTSQVLIDSWMLLSILTMKITACFTSFKK